MRATPFFVFALSFFSFYSVCPACALAIEPIASNKSATDNETEFEIRSRLNDTNADFFIPSDNSSVEASDAAGNSSDFILLGERLTDDGFFVSCDPDKKPLVCRDNLLEICRPINGINRCVCPENVSRAEDGKCTIFNECTSRSYHNCSSYALCVDLPRGYTCRCKAGYRDAAEVENTLPGRVCVSLHWVISGRKDGAFSAEATLIENGPVGATVADALTVVQPLEAFNDSSIANSTDVDTNDILADDPFSNEIESNFSTDAVSRNETNRFNSTINDTLASVSSTPISIASPRSIDKQGKSPKSIDKQDSLQTLDLLLTTPLSGGTLKDVFVTFDADGNDLISFWELRTAVDKYRLKLNDNEIHDMIKVADSTGEGLVDFGEFSSLMRKAS